MPDSSDQIVGVHGVSAIESPIAAGMSLTRAYGLVALGLVTMLVMVAAGLLVYDRIKPDMQAAQRVVETQASTAVALERIVESAKTVTAMQADMIRAQREAIDLNARLFQRLESAIDRLERIERGAQR